MAREKYSPGDPAVYGKTAAAMGLPLFSIGTMTGKKSASRRSPERTACCNAPGRRIRLKPPAGQHHTECADDGAGVPGSSAGRTMRAAGHASPTQLPVHQPRRKGQGWSRFLACRCVAARSPWSPPGARRQYIDKPQNLRQRMLRSVSADSIRRSGLHRSDTSVSSLVASTQFTRRRTSSARPGRRRGGGQEDNSLHRGSAGALCC